MIKTYEGFLDVFKKKQSINDIYNALEDKIKSNETNIGIKRHPEFISYKNTIYSGEDSLSRKQCKIQDIFFIRLKENKRKINCEIEINRENNFKSSKERMAEISEKFEINATEKIEIIIKEILSEVNALNFRFKTEENYKTTYIITLFENENENKVKDRKLSDEKRREFYKKVEDWVNSKFKELDMDNIKDMIDSYLRDDFEDIKFDNYDDTDGGLYINIRGNQREPDKSRIEHLKKKIVCNEFIERFLSEYGEECEVKTKFEGEGFQIQIKVAELPKELSDEYGKY